MAASSSSTAAPAPQSGFHVAFASLLATKWSIARAFGLPAGEQPFYYVGEPLEPVLKKAHWGEPLGVILGAPAAMPDPNIAQHFLLLALMAGPEAVLPRTCYETLTDAARRYKKSEKKCTKLAGHYSRLGSYFPGRHSVLEMPSRRGKAVCQWGEGSPVTLPGDWRQSWDGALPLELVRRIVDLNPGLHIIKGGICGRRHRSINAVYVTGAPPVGFRLAGDSGCARLLSPLLVPPGEYYPFEGRAKPPRPPDCLVMRIHSYLWKDGWAHRPEQPAQLWRVISEAEPDLWRAALTIATDDPCARTLLGEAACRALLGVGDADGPADGGGEGAGEGEKDKKDKEAGKSGVAVKLKEIPRICRGCACDGRAGRPLRRCGGCHLVRYCSRPCQERDWLLHAPVCAQAQKAS